MGAYFICRTTKSFDGAHTRFLTGRGGWTDDPGLARSFDSFLDAQCALRKRTADIVRADLVIPPVQGSGFKVQSSKSGEGHSMISDLRFPICDFPGGGLEQDPSPTSAISQRPGVGSTPNKTNIIGTPPVCGNAGETSSVQSPEQHNAFPKGRW